ncbi:hypothetical protein [Streptomyces sp. NBC_00996]|uniref:hypothetical protein n=1 Tax=Streptomyces sp. NBC_00996 TaxID=2903710 RepID=UPI00387083A9
MTDARPVHIGVTMVECGIPDADRGHPELAAMVGRGNYWAIGNGQSLAAQRNGDGRIRIYLSFRTAEDWVTTSGIPFQDPAGARAALTDLFADWAPQFSDVLPCAGSSYAGIDHINRCSQPTTRLVRIPRRLSERLAMSGRLRS